MEEFTTLPEIDNEEPVPAFTYELNREFKLRFIGEMVLRMIPWVALASVSESVITQVVLSVSALVMNFVSTNKHLQYLYMARSVGQLTRISASFAGMLDEHGLLADAYRRIHAPRELIEEIEARSRK